jgi:predicted esterase
MRALLRRLKVPRTARYFELGDASSPETWIVLHGYGYLAADFIARFQSVATGRRIIAPEGLSRFYRSGNGPVGASWMTREDRLAEISDYTSFLDLVTDDAAVASDRLTVLGFSQGAHTACRWVETHRSVDHLIVWGSLLPEDLDANRFTRALHTGKVTLVAGNRDRFVRRGDLELDLNRLVRMEIRAELMEFDGGHEIEPSVLSRLVRQSPE